METAAGRSLFFIGSKNTLRSFLCHASKLSAALALTVVILAGTLLSLPPFDWPLAFNAHLKDAAAAKYGEPPYGHAELSRLVQFARRTEPFAKTGSRSIRN